MIVGVGIDVVDVERFVQSLTRTPGLRDRLFTEHERRLPPASLAARFAAKEAVAKALGAPAGMQWQDCWVSNDEDGKPHLVLVGSVAEVAERIGAATFHLSLSHDAGIASAVVIAEA